MREAGNVIRGGLDARTPLVLLPFRIETRFVDSGASSELLVRIYPDQISVDAHDPKLTSGEITDGQTYWGIVWRAGTAAAGGGQVKTAWAVLVSRYHAPRAAWIVKSTAPANLTAQPAAPTADGADPVPPPAFIAPPSRPTSWNRAAIATMLPGRWTVVTVNEGDPSFFQGAPIQADLAVTLDPGGAGAFPAGSTVDAGMQWMVDFDAAVTAGMALRIPLDQSSRAGGFDAIYVYGVRNTADSAAELQALIDAHHYSDGFSFVSQGAPTKNTPDASSAWKIDESDFSFAVEQLPVPPADAESDAVRAANALGFVAASGTFDRVASGSGHGGRNGTDMVTSLWPATLGYFLQQMMSPVFSYDQVDAGRRWTLDNVIPRGPLAAIRAGKTPYALLPTTAMQFYPTDSVLGQQSLEQQLVAFFQKLRNAWRASTSTAPQFGGADPDQDLLHVLGMDASSMRFDGREQLGPSFVLNLQMLAGIPDTARIAWWALLAALAREAVAEYGSPSWNPFILACSYNGDQFELRYPTVTDKPLSETDPLDADAQVGATKMNYIDWLRTASADDVTMERYPAAAPPSALLYKLLRQSLLREYADIASRREISDGRMTVAQALEPELVAVSQSSKTLTSLDVLARPMPDNPSLSWAEFLVRVDATPESPYARLGELQASLQRLASLPTAELDRLFTETLDLCSHRLDAWLTGVVNAMLTRTRAERPQGLHAGGYGWVENVRPAAPRAPVTGVDLESVAALDALQAARVSEARRKGKQQGEVFNKLPAPQQPQVDNGGFIHAPSYMQAAAAAVLRAGYMSHKGTSSDALLSIDLSSERVKRALWTLDGVRGGQTLSALLGYRFEEGLDGRGLQVYVQPFRDRFPNIGPELTPTDPAAEAVTASDVVDALALRAAFDANQFPSGGAWGPGMPPPGADQDQVVAVLGELDDIVDAISDLSVSEAVFQSMRGNFERAGGLLDAVSKGTYAPEPQVVDGQRSGIDLTHRVMALFAGVPAAAAGWATGTRRALMEPSLDAWAGTLLPDPRLVRCLVSFTNGAGTTSTQIVSLADLGIGPLDFIALSDAGNTPQKSELEERIRYTAALAPGIDSLSISFASGGLPAGSITFPDALIAARAARGLVGSARAVQPSDLCETQVNAAAAGSSVLLSELQTRVSDALTTFEADLAALNLALAGLPANTVPARDALFACSTYGIAGTIPATASGPDDSLAVRANGAIAEMTKRRTAITSMPNVSVDDALAIVKVLFAGTVVVLPRLVAPNASVLHTALSASGTLIPNADRDASDAWFQQLTHVRPAISRLDAALTAAELLQAGRPGFMFAQLPVVASDRWLGLPIDVSAPPANGRVALAVLPSGNLATATDYAGLLIDEWPERIPSPKQSAAVSFHFEEPKSRAPQALLLAVCPDDRPTWDDALLLATLQETLDMAKIRTVDLDSIVDVGQILPALCVPMNLQPAATIGTRFRMTSIEIAKFNAKLTN